ncbi:hypothetical protein AB6A40_003236 [Gnathostoma spinigerum]|uniref:MAM domain-containing protein n=1 Tax=Gnathostoma spinigerum TaxID=75299 RepID=A0ABD6EB88_9BILA
MRGICDVHHHLVITILSICFSLSDGCAPIGFNGVPFGLNDYLMSRALGEKTVKTPTSVEEENPSLSSTHQSGIVSKAEDLSCKDFDEMCHWHNMRGIFVDELDWFQGSGSLDSSRLQLSTGTELTPDGSYAIVATDHAQLPGAKAILVSDIIKCQLGPAELRFMYWTSPEVRITVCTKSTTRAYPNFDYCSDSLERGDPGPAYININDNERQPFQIFIKAENFVFSTSNLQGGFAIIDDIEYFGELCDDSATMLHPKEMFDSVKSPFSDAFAPMELQIPSLTSTQRLHYRRQSVPSNSSGFPTTESTPSMLSVCKALHCTFDNSDCHQYFDGTTWSISRGNIEVPLLQIRRDASTAHADQAGGFAYIHGPIESSRFQSKPFSTYSDIFLLFAYYRTTKLSSLQLIAKQTDRPNEEILFTAPDKFQVAKRWATAMRRLRAGSYDYVAFDVKNLREDDVIGVDEITVLDVNNSFLC